MHELVTVRDKYYANIRKEMEQEANKVPQVSREYAVQQMQAFAITAEEAKNMSTDRIAAMAAMAGVWANLAGNNNTEIPSRKSQSEPQMPKIDRNFEPDHVNGLVFGTKIAHASLERSIREKHWKPEHKTPLSNGIPFVKDVPTYGHAIYYNKNNIFGDK